MVKRTIKNAAYLIAPRWAAWAEERSQVWRLMKEAKAIRRTFDHSDGLEAVVDAALTAPFFRANQKKSEILQLLTLLQEARPRYLCKIGADRGGTLLLFAHVAVPDARILSIDIHYSMPRRRINSHLARRGQHITCVQGDSHAPETLARVKQWLAGQALDFLFIDGDHSLAGVASDFRMYSPLVRQGGIIAFHDIVPDFKTRYGIETPSDVGQVPAFWEALKRQHSAAQEFIEDAAQDGYGIGVLRQPEGSESSFQAAR